MLDFAVSPPFDPTSALVPDALEAGVPWLSLSILFPIVGALIVPFVPDKGDGKQVRWFALGIALITFLITGAAYLNGYAAVPLVGGAGILAGLAACSCRNG